MQLLSSFPPSTKIPLEREYEAWLIRGMQDYFEQRRIPFHIMAFSPYYEKAFPADAEAHLRRFKKAFALQFKRPEFVRNGMTWEIDAIQHMKIEKIKSIFYALPTFKNRRAYKVALHHALFWHPSWKSEYLGEPIFINKNKSTIRFKQGKSYHLKPKKLIKGYSRTLRWGGLIEAIERCYIGEPAKEFIKEINTIKSQHDKLKKSGNDTLLDKEEFYAIFIGSTRRAYRGS